MSLSNIPQEYNHFTIKYLEAIKTHLHIVINENGKAIFVHDRVTPQDIMNLKYSLSRIWQHKESAVKVLTDKIDSNTQCGLFGIVNELDIAIKVGLLLGDRIVLIDYLYERILKKNPEDINLDQLGVISSSLVALLPLAKCGRIVIIQSPFQWFNESKRIIREVSIKTSLTPNLMSLLNMLSITKHCKLQPFTIAESDENYQKIVNSDIDNVDYADRTSSIYSYNSILGGLLSEKILNEENINIALSLRPEEFYNRISISETFNQDYLNTLTIGGALNSNERLNRIKSEIQQGIKSKAINTLKDIGERTAVPATVAGSMISISLGILTSSALAVTGGLFSLSGTLLGNLKKSKNETSIISVFNRICS